MVNVLKVGESNKKESSADQQQQKDHCIKKEEYQKDICALRGK